ncbi:ferritin-like protein [Streptomyces roseoverticillatus]|uniref:ferritin-like protein n=1 Tax=Streptomyces roseoverticillatus TaxID=66429 RepID=UPI001F1D0A3E|nr:ferritin-like protein [Streptomyces roseoverticillatus]MCF3103127.1 ferritin-like protein [Streptomyces roseoverticillatus]
MLLRVASEIEHSLMVQYLFAAYSLGGPQVPERLREDVRRWQEIILGIAKEEMGHLLTVQNLLVSLGGPVNLGREDYPWGTDFYPFPFTLRRLTRESLAQYICAESPLDWTGEEAERIKRLAAGEQDVPVNRVGALYERLSDILRDRNRIPDTAFQASTLPYQASWDEWGRGYVRGERGRDSGNVPETQSPDLLILRVRSRDTALSALTQIGEQGEALPTAGTPDGENPEEPSHFQRFLTVFRELERVDRPDQDAVARPVAENPRTDHRLNEETMALTAALAAGAGQPQPEVNPITDPEAADWGHLFNLRYRMLLTDLAHAFRLIGPLDNGATLTARGSLIHRAFGEMYNLRAIAGTLLRLPLGEEGSSEVLAGPPFEMPYTLDLPAGDRNRWLLQRDLTEASMNIIDTLLSTTSTAGGEAYLRALRETDTQACGVIDRILAEG